MEEMLNVSRGYNVYDNIAEVLDKIHGAIYNYEKAKELEQVCRETKDVYTNEYSLDTVDERVDIIKDLLKMKILGKKYTDMTREGLLTSISRSKIFNDARCTISNKPNHITINYSKYDVKVTFFIKNDEVVGIE